MYVWFLEAFFRLMLTRVKSLALGYPQTGKQQRADTELAETLASLGIMGEQLWDPIKSLNTIMLIYTGSFRGPV